MLQLRIIACVTLCCVCGFGNATASEVVVELNSGQRLRAQSLEHDPKSDSRVILKVGSDRVQIHRSISWKRVTRLAAPAEALMDLSVPDHVAVVDTVDLSDPGLQSPPHAAIDSIPPPAAPDLHQPNLFELPTVLAPALHPWAMDYCRSGSVPCTNVYDPGIVIGIRYENPLVCCSMSSLEPILAASEPRELLVTTRPFNRYGLADWNSLEVSVQGRTEDGLLCPVRGSLRCALHVRRAGLVRAYGENYFEDSRELVQLGQWSQFLDGSETDASSTQKVVFALPPQSPDHNLQLGSFGLLTAVLDIPGQGRLATSSPVTLRQFDPIRGRSVVDYGTSLLPLESVSEGLSPGGNWPAPLSGLRPDSRRFTIQP